ncbi:MAG: hypothetical protein K0S47_873 [Herbinix sp.]|jgi:hypothetical protein|nr:hypothetical protein [Herbinix sp.]
MKRIVSLLLCGAMLTLTVPSQGITAASIAVGEPNPSTTSSSKAGQEPTTAALETVIKAVKAKIEIPKEYSSFDYYYSSYSAYGDANWQLVWRNPTTDAGIQINSDEKGHINFFRKYDYNAKVSAMPMYLKKELKAKADEFLKKIEPLVFSKLSYVDATFAGVYNGYYTYEYQRMENGVAFPDNTVSVSVDSATAEVVGASINWLYDEKVPDGKTSITEEEAAKLIGKNVKMELVYLTDYYHIYTDSFRGETTGKKAFLAYQPSNSYIAIDAKTGEVYLNRSEWVTTDRNGATEEAATADASGAKADGGAYQLTEQEIAKLTELKQLITKEKAIDAVVENDALFIDKNISSYSAYLNKSQDSKGNDLYVWNIELRDPREVSEKDTDNYRAYASAQVNAKTGKIIGFYASVNNYYDEKNQKWNTVKIKYDEKEAQDILERFLKRQLYDRFQNTKLSEQTNDYIAYYKNETPVYGGYNYQYNRVNEGVMYPYNGIYGSVDGVTGKIYSYRSTWDDTIQFESPKGAITPEKAFDYYIQKDDFHLVYEINEVNSYNPDKVNNEKYTDFSDAYSVEREIRLVYRTDINPIYISPFTGEQLNYNGEVYKESKPYAYKDVADTAANKEILLLSDMNIGFEGEYFYPDKAITVGEITTLLEKIGYGYYDGSNQNENSSLITKEQMAAMFIKKLGFEKVASIKGIYSTGYADQDKIDPSYIGAIALAKGMELIGADQNNNFNPKNNVTRAEAVHFILQYIKVQNNGIYY